jgi:hypothetical protein
MGVERTLLFGFLSLYLIVILPVRTIKGQLSLTDNEHAVDIPILAGRDVGIELGQHLRIEPDVLRVRNRPVLGTLR